MASTKVNKPKKIGNFVSRWFTRYLLSTELYMVEPWEKVFIHMVFAMLFGVFWYINHSIIVNVISHVRDSSLVQQL